MFTGIITDMARSGRSSDRGDLRGAHCLWLCAASIELGASIACDGVCLTVVDRGPAETGAWFDVDISAETLGHGATSATGRTAWALGGRVNLERALRLGDEMGGHIVSGHVDGRGRGDRGDAGGRQHPRHLHVPEPLARFIAPKGSVALNGTSLTVNEVAGCDFGINLIPHTRAVTTWGDVRPGDLVNLEIDTLARYVARLREMEG